MLSQFRFVSCMEKCFIDSEIDTFPTLSSASALRGERFSFQLVWRGFDPDGHWQKNAAFVRIDSPLAEFISVATVESVPVRFPTYPDSDDGNYLRTTPGLYPDLLQPLCAERQVFVTAGRTSSLWIDTDIPDDQPGGTYPITISLIDTAENVLFRDTFSLTILPALLPPQTLLRTEWFHADCLADYYRVPVFSEEHWRIIENFLRCAARNGVNLILTPVFTPPLDTAVGGERTTVQLTDVTCTNGVWSFGFDKLSRWIDLCERCGIRMLEISHLFTQWGCAHAPKIMATVDGEYKRVFGWETDALGEEYGAFLDAFLPALKQFLLARGIGTDRCVFHVSDEPGLEHLAQYRAARERLTQYLPGYTIMDALSNFEFYQTGAIDHPIPANDHIEPFLQANVPQLWTYYCCGQSRNVSNRFLSMPGARTRILGVQLYKFRIAGFLQWGFNFYNSQGSAAHIDPYVCNDGEYFVPAGDAFQVYPAADGSPYETVHQRLVTAAMYDLRALQLAESLCGRDAVMTAIDGELSDKITFRQFPHEGSYLLGLREKIHALIAQVI